MTRPHWLARFIVFGLQLGAWIVLVPFFALLSRSWLRHHAKPPREAGLTGQRGTVERVLETGWLHIRIGGAWHLAVPAETGGPLAVGDTVTVTGANGVILQIEPDETAGGE